MNLFPFKGEKSLQHWQTTSGALLPGLLDCSFYKAPVEKFPPGNQPGRETFLSPGP